VIGQLSKRSIDRRRLVAAGVAAVCWTTHVLSAAAQEPANSAAALGIEIVPAIKAPANPGQLRESDLAGYLMVYFKDQTHSAYLAISRDGYTYTDLSKGRPIFDGKVLAEQKGVRDPHIARGPDGAFYLAMTDLHIAGQRAGLRDTAWERPEEQYGWGNNRAIVLMKSYDLIHWTHADIRIDKAFPALGDVGVSWAPQTVYDAAAGKMMVYFTIRIGSGDGDCHIYYSYPNSEFTKLETTPKRVADIRCIDADITHIGDKFHMFYVSKATIRHAVSDKINAGYVTVGDRIDPEKVSTEAPNVFRRLGTDRYVLMYDVYGARPNNMGFSETTDFETFTDIGHFNEGAMQGTNFERPKHGAVTHLTGAEIDAIAKHWGVQLDR
jgi:hypothetical protein